VARLLLQGGAMAFFLVVGRLHPRVRGVGLLNRDLVWNLLNGVLLFILVAPLVGWVSGHAQLGLVSMDWLSQGWAQALGAFIVVDLARYALHVAGHRVPFLWSFHRVHHSAEFLDSTTGLRMHMVDFLQLSALPIVLFGVVLDTSQFVPWALPVALSVGVVFDGFQHANLRMDSRTMPFRIWNLLLNNPHFHSWHHTRDGHLCDGNYGNTLLIWDRIFGTEVTQAEPPALYGIAGQQRLRNDPWSWLWLREMPTVADGTGASDGAGMDAADGSEA
jgi:sterol desaturase/sphingolipid hydroxylase (fatty acid hydroxylase superfamily)